LYFKDTAYKNSAK